MVMRPLAIESLAASPLRLCLCSCSSCTRSGRVLFKMSGKNTLFNYFQRSPVTQLSPSNPKKINETPDKSSEKKRKADSVLKARNDNQPKTPTSRRGSSKTPAKEKKRVKLEEDEEVEDEVTPELKRRKLDIPDEDSGDEFVPDDESDSESEASPEPSPDENSEVDEDLDTIKKKQRKTTIAPSRTPKARKKPISLSSKDDKQESATSDGTRSASDDWPHLKLTWLHKDKLKDAQGRPVNHPDYDPKTLYVPSEFKNSLTPAVRQWWEVKSNLFDCVLFFKLGKFYELYHMDAIVGMTELNLTPMRGEQAHVGFPESAYGRYAATLVEKGYKVARIEQTETPDTMNERLKTMIKPTKFDKVVKREICQITTPGTRIFSVLDGECKEAGNRYLLAIVEKEEDRHNFVYGVCFVDTSIGTFHIGQFPDDRHCSRLRTLIAHHPPTQILYEKNCISPKLQELFRTGVATALKEGLHPESQFWSPSKTLITLSESDYFSASDFPVELKNFIRATGDSFPLTAESHCEFGIQALGAIIFYLKRCQIDHQLLSMAHFSVYNVKDGFRDTTSKELQTVDIANRNMVLDAITLKNLSIVEDEYGGIQGTLLQKLDNCSTAFGKRLLYQWICSPLTNIKSIEARQAAIKALLEEPQIIGDVRSAISGLPDLERSFAKIYSQSSHGLKAEHPDARAILFDEHVYSKRKICEFVATINGFDKIQQMMTTLQSCGVGDSAELLANCCYHPHSELSGKFPDLSEHISFFKKAFNHAEAQRVGRIIPIAGVDNDYDQVCAELKDLERETEDYLRLQRRHFGCNVIFVGTDKKRFQLEVPETAASKAGDNYDLQSQKKGFKRYYTREGREFVERMMAAEEKKRKVLMYLRQRLFSKFCERSEAWNIAVECTAVLDVLVSLAEYCRTEETICIPKFEPAQRNKQTYVKLIEGKYPCNTVDETFIPNSTIIGVDPHVILVTGPNMGGKSTLMRQLGLIVIMAHMGCHVPAESLELNPVDRIFTRIGANDDIMAGGSTFYVELCETASILHHATTHSLALIDELGRGTSTYDGTAIASAVLKELCRMKCRTLFSTHYHSLVEDFRKNPDVMLGHMTCMVENDDDNDDEATEEKVIFLYKFGEGACPKSYGFNAARLGGIPTHITKRAQQCAKQLESEISRKRSVKKLLRGSLKVNALLSVATWSLELP
ncbi:DNA mismatch repair protein Msh6 [Bemisia tabaci]